MLIPQIECTDLSLAQQAAEYERASKAENTRRAYKSCWQSFVTWCESRAICPLPATVEAISLFLADRAKTRSISTISVSISAIEHFHRELGYEIVGNPDMFRNVRKGIKRLCREKLIQHKAKPLTIPDLTILGRFKSFWKWDYRDKAIIAMAFFGALRRSEVVEIDREHVDIGAEGARITLLRTKTCAIPITIALSRASSLDICPVHALEEWIRVSEIESGPLFRPIAKDNRIINRRLTPQSVRLIIISRFGKEYSGHSPRRGLVTAEAKAGISPYQIAKHSRHKDFNVLIGYVEQEQAFETSSTRLLNV